MPAAMAKTRSSVSKLVLASLGLAVSIAKPWTVVVVASTDTDKAGHFHCIYHRNEKSQGGFSDTSVAGGHAYSLDGFKWYKDETPAYSTTVVRRQTQRLARFITTFYRTH